MIRNELVRIRNGLVTIGKALWMAYTPSNWPFTNRALHMLCGWPIGPSTGLLPIALHKIQGCTPLLPPPHETWKD